MSDQPAILLMLAVAVIAIAVLLLRPGFGYVWRWLRLVRNGRRVLVEDALKHLHDAEYTGRPATLQSLTGALEISGNRAADLAAGLEAGGLVRSTVSGLELTPEGRSDALRVIRVHRLWERFLADRTGLEESHWHREADRLEHRMTSEEVTRLAARLGDPRFDPHGDPIPTAAGEIPPRRGQPITALEPGAAAVVVHVEDEPEAIYAQLLAQDIRPGVPVRLLDSAVERIRLEVDGEEHVLAPVVAANVWVTPLEKPQAEEEPAGPSENLTDLKPGEAAVIVGLSRACRGIERRRLLDLGIHPGANVRAELTAPSGDPTAYRVCGAMIALREEQARHIRVTRGQDPAVEAKSA
jgi:DtxR family Mn-dependent transcriptional regulator